jgi:chromosome segregation ATPase
VLEAEVSSLKAQLASAKADAAAARASAASAATSASGASDAQVSSLRAELAQLSRQLEAADAKADGASKECESLRKELAAEKSKAAQLAAQSPKAAPAATPTTGSADKEVERLGRLVESLTLDAEKANQKIEDLQVRPRPVPPSAVSARGGLVARAEGVRREMSKEGGGVRRAAEGMGELEAPGLLSE